MNQAILERIQEIKKRYCWEPVQPLELKNVPFPLDNVFFTLAGDGSIFFCAGTNELGKVSSSGEMLWIKPDVKEAGGAATLYWDSLLNKLWVCDHNSGDITLLSEDGKTVFRKKINVALPYRIVRAKEHLLLVDIKGEALLVLDSEANVLEKVKFPSDLTSPFKIKDVFHFEGKTWALCVDAQNPSSSFSVRLLNENGKIEGKVFEERFNGEKKLALHLIVDRQGMFYVFDKYGSAFKFNAQGNKIFEQWETRVFRSVFYQSPFLFFTVANSSLIQKVKIETNPA